MENEPVSDLFLPLGVKLLLAFIFDPWQIFPQVIEFDRNPNALRDEILVDHSWALGEDGALAVPMDRLFIIDLWQKI